MYQDGDALKSKGVGVSGAHTALNDWPSFRAFLHSLVTANIKDQPDVSCQAEIEISVFVDKNFQIIPLQI